VALRVRTRGGEERRVVHRLADWAAECTVTHAIAPQLALLLEREARRVRELVTVEAAQLLARRRELLC
jgi:hypothetical protein